MDRAAIREGLDRLWSHGDASILAPGCDWSVTAAGDPQGPDAVTEDVIEPLRRALSGLHRRDILFLGGSNIREEGGEWCAAITHYTGNFRDALWGIPASGSLAMLRAGEFFRVEDERITKARIILDLPDLARQGGIDLYRGHRYGTEVTFPPPLTQDGLCPDSEGAEESLRIIQGMLGDLHEYDPETSGSANQTGKGGWWAEDMFWWGPAGIGSNFRWEGFVKDHRAPFLHAFPDRKGGDHYCRIGDGNYAAISGWPSMTMTHRGDYLGVPATDKPLTLRVMDFYRCANGQIAENWVMLDYVDMFARMGVDLLGRASE